MVSTAPVTDVHAIARNRMDSGWGCAACKGYGFFYWQTAVDDFGCDPCGDCNGEGIDLHAVNQMLADAAYADMTGGDRA